MRTTSRILLHWSCALGGLGLIPVTALAQAGAPYAQPPVAYYYPGVPYGWGAAPGAAIGALAGAAASPNPGPILFGALLGGMVGHATTTPPLAPAWAFHPRRTDPELTGLTPYPPAPAASAPVDASPFIDRWQSFFEPYPRPR
jgi:hypothetical protein